MVRALRGTNAHGLREAQIPTTPNEMSHANTQAALGHRRPSCSIPVMDARLRITAIQLLTNGIVSVELI